MKWSPQTIIVPIDFSDESFSALDLALDIAGGRGSVHAIHVLHDLSPVEPGEIWYTIDKDTRKEHTITALRERLQDSAYDTVHIAVEIGDPGHCIADYTRDHQGDLIVMPSHGRSGIKRLLIGSVAERVTRLSHCPVLIMRT
jgi:nucleotide-binding universal stress UspA family protein